jgi:hypothetical protein
VLEAEDRDDFHHRLAIRRDERLREMQKAWDDIGNFAACIQNAWKRDAELWDSFLRLSSNISFGNLI